MNRGSTRARGLLNASAAAEAIYRPLAVDETRRAVARYLDALSRERDAREAQHATLEAIGKPCAPIDRLDAFALALSRERANAEAHLLRLLVAWDPRAKDFHAEEAERRYWPPRGAIVDGVLYLAAPCDPDACAGLKPGEKPRDVDTWVMTLVAVPMADVVDLDDKAAPAPAAAPESPLEAAPSEPPRRREIPDAACPPLLRMSTTICPPWDPDPITLEVIALPAGHGSECEDSAIPAGVPIHRSDLPALQEAGWTQHEAAGVTLHVRAIR